MSFGRPSLSERLYRVLLAIYPRTFQAEAEDELVQIFRDAHAEARARGLAGVAGLWVRTVADLARSATAERWGAGARGRATGWGRRGEGNMIQLLRDVRYATRTLARSPGFTLAAVSILALGIGANTTMFSIVDAIYFEDPPHVVEPDRLVRIYRTSESGTTGALAYPDFRDYREDNDVFEDMMAYDASTLSVTLSVDDDRSSGQGMFVSDNYFDVLGVRPAAGRWFLPEEDQTLGTHPVTVLSHGLWVRAFESDPDAVGRSLRVNGNAFTVVGVAPDGFRGPSPIEETPDLWVPIHSTSVLRPSVGEYAIRRIEGSIWVWLWSIGRLKDGVTLDVAQERMSVLARDLEETYPEWNEGWGTRLYENYRFHPPGGSSLTTMAMLLFAVVAAVLLIASANIAILLLARGSARRRDVAIRLAIGAGRGRVVVAALVESVLLALAGAVAGAGIAYAGAGYVASLLPTTFSVSFEPDASVFVFATGLALLTSLLFGLVPALQTGRVDVNGAMKGGASGVPRSRLRGSLVVAQVALTLMLGIAAALLGRSLAKATSIPLGFGVEDRVLMSVSLANHGYGEEEGKAFVAAALDRVRALPQVRAAGTIRMTPFRGRWSTTILTPGGVPGDGTGAELSLNSVAPGTLEALGIPLLGGRDFTSADGPDDSPAAIVAESMAHEYWPDQDPIGQPILGPEGGERWRVIGVVGDARVFDLNAAPERFAYLNVYQRYDSGVTFVVHGEPGASLGGPVRQALLDLDPSLAIASVQTMEDVVEGRIGRFRTAATLVAAFGGLGLVLSLMGLYGVLSYMVVQARRDIGIRVALGATARQVRWAVLRRALLLTGGGAALGVVGALAGGRLLASFLFGVAPRDPVILFLAPLLMLAVAVAAASVPASRAAGVDPMTALKVE